MRATLLVVAVTASGCFAEAPSPISQDCPVGSKSCPCTDGGACDPPLECHAQSQNCYDPECDEGSRDCPCFEDMCFGDLVCADGLCQAPRPATDSSGPSESTEASQSSASVGDTMGDTSVEETSVVDSGTTDTTGVDDTGCIGCFAAQLGTACESQNDECVGAGCMAMRDCVAAQTSSFSQCCEMISDGHAPWAALANCLAEDVCEEACAGVVITCS